MQHIPPEGQRISRPLPWMVERSGDGRAGSHLDSGNLTNNITDRQGNEIPKDLVSTCHDYGIFDTISFEEKEANRMRIARGS